MRFVVVAHTSSETNEALADAAESLGLPAAVLTPRDALRVLEPGDVALARLDVRAELDGIESGMLELERLAEGGVHLLNTAGALAAVHDKLLTARTLRRAGLPHPHTLLITQGAPPHAPELPLVLKPRFGSWGREVTLCRTRDELAAELTRIERRSWYREHGVLAQELVPPKGWDIRVVVAAGRVIGAAQRIAAEGEWRTNVSLGGRTESFAPPPLARTLAIAAASAARADLVGVDLLPTRNGFVVSELNGAVDFHPWYALGAADVHADAVSELLYAVYDRRAARTLTA
jgi:RimK family alpha-L-glutamate ligase